MTPAQARPSVCVESGLERNQGLPRGSQGSTKAPAQGTCVAPGQDSNPELASQSSHLSQKHRKGPLQGAAGERLRGLALKSLSGRERERKRGRKRGHLPPAPGQWSNVQFPHPRPSGQVQAHIPQERAVAAPPSRRPTGPGQHAEPLQRQPQASRGTLCFPRDRLNPGMGLLQEDWPWEWQDEEKGMQN